MTLGLDDCPAHTVQFMAKRRSKIAHTLASMAEAESIGVGSVPEVEQPVAVLVVSPVTILQHWVTSNALVLSVTTQIPF